MDLFILRYNIIVNGFVFILIGVHNYYNYQLCQSICFCVNRYLIGSKGANLRIILYFTGGFSAFEECFPEYCVRQEDNNGAILGLCNLKIADDSAYGTSDSEDSGNPHVSPFPVEVIPHLFLGNAKNSADITQLKTYGIKYILNVTPNVPNMFENDSTFRYLQIPISDNLSQNLSGFFPKAIAFIGEW